MNETTRGRTPAQLYALIIGATLVAAGILGFFYSSAFGDPGEVDAVLGILERTEAERAAMGRRVLAVTRSGYSYDAWLTRWQEAVGIA